MNVPVVVVSLLVTMQENQRKDTPQVRRWCTVLSATCAATPIETHLSSSANACLLGINKPLLRKSLKLLW